jgi:hypothetical protein
MGDTTLSGYKAASAAIAWAAGQDLNSLTDNEWTDLSDEIDSSSNLYMMVDLDMILASAAFTGTDSALEIYLIPSIDGTNYPTWVGNVTTDEQENNQYFVDSITTSGTTAAQRQNTGNRAIALPNGKYKWAFRSRLNVTTAGSGNSVEWRPHQFTSA